MKAAPLTVCLCVANAEECVVSLNEIAAGHVFGPQQHLKLLLHGQDTESLDDLVLSTQESCYRLVDDVSVAPATLEHYDVAAVLLSHNKPSLSPKSSGRSSLSSYIFTVSNFLGRKLSDTSKILVLGPDANMAASLLSRRLGCSGGNQLLAFQTHENTGSKSNCTGSPYKTAYTLCQTVSTWWAGTKDTSTNKQINAGIKLFVRNSSTAIQAGGAFFSVPVNIVGEKTFKIDPIFHIDTEELNKVLFETERRLCEMRDVTKIGCENDGVKMCNSHL